MLWSGDSANIDEALQLLYIIDIIALWGEHKYKPFSGACIRRFEAELNNKAPPPLDDTLLAHQMEINKETFSWLFPEPQSQLASPAHLITHHQSQNLISRRLGHSPNPESSQLLRGIAQLSLISFARDYIIPERDYFIWLHDRDHYDGDLLIVRVDREGYILPPLVVFHSSRWKRRDFREVLKEEQARIPDNVLTEFRVQEDRTSYVENCVLQGPKYFREPQTQFCAIVPLDRRAYERQRGLDSMEETPFASFERRLGLPRLVRDAGKANDQWCECEAPYNEYSPSMIQCDNLKCPMGWYHKKCVDLDEDFTADRWLCDQCLRNWKSNEMSYFEDKKISEKIREASDARIQRARTLARVWEEHDWPSAEKVRRFVNRLSCRIIIRTTAKNTFDTVPDLNIKDIGESRCWAIVRDIPKVMMAVRPVGQGVVRGTNQRARRITDR